MFFSGYHVHRDVRSIVGMAVGSCLAFFGACFEAEIRGVLELFL